jgi:hypothetical protein
MLQEAIPKRLYYASPNAPDITPWTRRRASADVAYLSIASLRGSAAIQSLSK